MLERDWKSLRYEVIDEDIHYIDYTEISRNAVDEYMIIFEHLIENTPHDGVIKILVGVDGTDRSQSLVYVQRSLGRLFAIYPKRAALRVARLRYTINTMSNVEVLMMNVFQRGKDSIEYFLRDNVNDAIAWLHKP